MAKPIFIVGYDKGVDIEHVYQYQKSLEKKLSDYHVIAYISGNDEPSFQVFYEKDFNEVKYEELKQIIEKEVINAPNKNI